MRIASEKVLQFIWLKYVIVVITIILLLLLAGK